MSSCRESLPLNFLSHRSAHEVGAGLTFVVTGRLERRSRQQIEGLIKELGGQIGDAVSKKTDYLVVGADAGSKLAKAQKLGTTILDEDAFDALLAERQALPPA